MGSSLLLAKSRLLIYITVVSGVDTASGIMHECDASVAARRLWEWAQEVQPPDTVCKCVCTLLNHLADMVPPPRCVVSVNEDTVAFTAWGYETTKGEKGDVALARVLRRFLPMSGSLRCLDASAFAPCQEPACALITAFALEGYTCADAIPSPDDFKLVHTASREQLIATFIASFTARQMHAIIASYMCCITTRAPVLWWLVSRLETWDGYQVVSTGETINSLRQYYVHSLRHARAQNSSAAATPPFPRCTLPLPPRITHCKQIAQLTAGEAHAWLLLHLHGKINPNVATIKAAGGNVAAQRIHQLAASMRTYPQMDANLLISAGIPRDVVQTLEVATRLNRKKQITSVFKTWNDRNRSIFTVFLHAVHMLQRVQIIRKYNPAPITANVVLCSVCRTIRTKYRHLAKRFKASFAMDIEHKVATCGFCGGQHISIVDTATHLLYHGDETITQCAICLRATATQRMVGVMHLCAKCDNTVETLTTPLTCFACPRFKRPLAMHFVAYGDRAMLGLYGACAKHAQCVNTRVVAFPRIPELLRSVQVGEPA